MSRSLAVGWCDCAWIRLIDRHKLPYVGARLAGGELRGSAIEYPLDG